MNAFARYGDTLPPRLRKKADRKVTALDKKRDEQNQLSKAYRRAKKQWWEETLSLPRGDDVRALLAELRKIEDPDEFMEFVRPHADWVRALHADLRFLFVAEVGAIITKRRIDANLPPFDDPLPIWMDPNAEISVYEEIKEMIQ